MGHYDWKLTGQYNINSVVRGIDFEDNFYCCTDNSMNCEAFIAMIDPRISKFNKLMSLDVSPTKIFKTDIFLVFFSDNNGNIYKMDIRTNSIISNTKIHQSKM